MSPDPTLDGTVALFVRLVTEPGTPAAESSTSTASRQLRLGWAIFAGGSPLLTLDCKLPPGNDPDAT